MFFFQTKLPGESWHLAGIPTSNIQNHLQHEEWQYLEKYMNEGWISTRDILSYLAHRTSSSLRQFPTPAEANLAPSTPPPTEFTVSCSYWFLFKSLWRFYFAFKLCVCHAWTWACAHLCSACNSWKRELDSLELGFQVVVSSPMWLLGIELWSLYKWGPLLQPNPCLGILPLLFWCDNWHDNTLGILKWGKVLFPWA